MVQSPDGRVHTIPLAAGRDQIEPDAPVEAEREMESPRRKTRAPSTAARVPSAGGTRRRLQASVAGEGGRVGNRGVGRCGWVHPDAR
jgi:hypothetical protein